jgi:hypothetical protein
MHSNKLANSFVIMAIPAGIEPAANSLEVVRKANNLNDRSDKIGFLATLFNKTEWPTSPQSVLMDGPYCVCHCRTLQESAYFT